MSRRQRRRWARMTKSAYDIQSYERVLEEYGITDADRQIVDAEGSYADEDTDLGDSYEIDRSEIEGKGAYAAMDFEIDDVVGRHTTREGLITPLGRYLNHGNRPNCRLEWANAAVVVFAISVIYAAEELTIDYQTIVERQFRKVVRP